MFRAVVLVLLVSSVALSGCLTDSDPVEGLREIFGASAIEEVNGTHRIVIPVLEGQLQGLGMWTNRSNLTVEVPKVTLEKMDPGPQGGGGVTQALEVPEASSTLNVRFTKADRLGSYDARWAVVRNPGANLNWTTPQDASKPFAVPIASVGPLFVAAELLQDGNVAATVMTPYVATMTVHWVVESAVRPVKPLGAPAPSNYDEMADVFPFSVATAGARINAKTSFRGAYDGSKGTDVDLELAKPDGKPLVCSANGGTGSNAAMLPTPNDTAQAVEKLFVPNLAAGTWSVRVGAMQYGNGCGTDDAFYHNAGPVPYTLDIELSF